MRVVRRLWRASIWHPDAISPLEGEIARDVKRWILPIVDSLLILGSALALAGQMPTLTIVYSPVVSTGAAIAVLVCAVGCLVGVAFPRLRLLEMIAKLGLVFILALYALLLLGLTAMGSDGRGFTAGVTAACVVLPLWRIVWLGRERRRNRTET